MLARAWPRAATVRTASVRRCWLAAVRHAHRPLRRSPGSWTSPSAEPALGEVGVDPLLGAVDRDLAAVRQHPLRPGVAERHADADDGLGVVALDLGQDGVALVGDAGGRGPRPRVGCGGRRRAGGPPGRRRRRRAARARRGLRTIQATWGAGRSSSEVSSSRTPPARSSGEAGPRPAVRTHWRTSRQPPQVGPVTERAGPDQCQGSVARARRTTCSASGLAQSGPTSSDSPGSVTSRRSPVEQCGAQGAGVDVVDAAARARGGPGRSRRRSWRRRCPTATGAGWCCRWCRGTAWGRRARRPRRGGGPAGSGPRRPRRPCRAGCSGSRSAALTSRARSLGRGAELRGSSGTRPAPGP